MPSDMIMNVLSTWTLFLSIKTERKVFMSVTISQWIFLRTSGQYHSNHPVVFFVKCIIPNIRPYSLRSPGAVSDIQEKVNSEHPVKSFRFPGFLLRSPDHNWLPGFVVVLYFLYFLYFLNRSYNVLFFSDFVLYSYIFPKNEDSFDKSYISSK